MTDQIYYNNYPFVDVKTLSNIGGQDKCKQFIYDFNSAMLNIGLVRSADAGQLDVDNISDVSFTGLVDNTTVYPAANNSSCTVFYAPIIYIFTDSLQASAPITLKYEFGFGKTLMHNSSTQPTLAACFITRLTITFKTQTFTFDSAPHLLYSSNTNASTAINIANGNYFTRYIDKNSAASYNADKGYLFLNICPNITFNSDYYTQYNAYPNSFIGFVLQRSMVDNAPTGDYISLINFNSYVSNNTIANSAAISATSYSRRIINSSSTSSTFTTSFQLPTSSVSFMKNGQYYVGMSTQLDINNNIPVYDPYVLLINSAGALQSNIIYDVNISDSESYQYITIANNDICSYPFNNANGLLVYFS